jgi:hypothetical protein
MRFTPLDLQKNRWLLELGRLKSPECTVAEQRSFQGIHRHLRLARGHPAHLLKWKRTQTLMTTIDRRRYRAYFGESVIGVSNETLSAPSFCEKSASGHS